MKRVFISLSILFITQSVFADFTCDTGVHKYFALYELNSYTCASGYYLPANTDGCRACPTGFTCPGGTFEFNPDRFQGIEIMSVSGNTMNNVCAANFPKKMFAAYEPNNVAVNFNDGTGNTTTITCTYDGLVNLPETPPTRPGYVFNGWKLQTNN